MTGLSPFDPGNELRCEGCEFRVPDGCLIATELRDDGEHMTLACCPRVEDAGDIQCPDYKDIWCPICGGALPCQACLTELRCCHA